MTKLAFSELQKRMQLEKKEKTRCKLRFPKC